MAFLLQMNWQPDLLHQKRKNGPPIGLKNLGNTCYLNSVLQCLTYTPPLANFCLKFQHSSICDSSQSGNRKHDCPFCILENRIARSLSLDITLDSPSTILRCLSIFAEHFRTGHQEDAHEFLRYVIDACHATCLRLKKRQQQRKKKGAVRNVDSGNNSTVVSDIFGGALQSQVKCLACGGESNKMDEIMDLSLDVFHSSSLEEAMQDFFRAEDLDGNNKYKCENCNELVDARKQMFIHQAPKILVIQLKRFEGIYGGKIDKSIPFEEELVLSSYMSKASKDANAAYKLFGAIIHSGHSPESGHYYAYVKDVIGRWYCCNDSYVSLSTLQEVLSEKVYILFFSRTDRHSMAAGTSSSNICLKPRVHMADNAVTRRKIDCPSPSYVMKSADTKCCNGRINVPRKKNGCSVPKYPTDGRHKRKLRDVNAHSGSDRDIPPKNNFEELTAELEEEAYVVLSSSDWSKGVYEFMLSTTREGDGIGSSDDKAELKKKLVAEARSKFLSQVPERLKAGLINRLYTFFKESP